MLELAIGRCSTCLPEQAPLPLSLQLFQLEMTMRILPLVTAALLTLGVGRAQNLSVTQYGPTCGPVATGEILPQGNHNRFAFTVSNAAPRTSVMNIIGVNQTNTPIDFGGVCYLLTDIAFSQIHQTDASGSYTWSHSLPGGASGWSGEAFVQFAEITFDQFNNLIVRTSNGVHVAPN